MAAAFDLLKRNAALALLIALQWPLGMALERWLNPYYRYELARRAYLARRYDEAVGHLQYAIRKRPREDQFYFLLGLSYLEKGSARAARRWLARAEEVAATDALKRRYSSKVDTLLRREKGIPE